MYDGQILKIFIEFPLTDSLNDVWTRFYLKHYTLAVPNDYFLKQLKMKSVLFNLGKGHICLVDKSLMTKNAEPSNLIALSRKDN